MNQRLHVTVAAIAHRDQRYLLVEEWVQGERRLNQPAGHVEPNEGLIDAVIRETLEETAYCYVPQGLVGIYRWRHPHSTETFLRTTFFGDISRQESGRKLDANIIQSVWLSIDEILVESHRLRSPMVLQCIRDYEDGARYPLSLLRDLD